MESLEDVRKSLEEELSKQAAEQKADTKDEDLLPNQMEPGVAQPIEGTEHSDATPEEGTEKNDNPTARPPESQSNDTNDAQYPSLSNNPPESETATAVMDDDEDDEVTKSFHRSVSDTDPLQRNRGAVYEKVGEEGVSRMTKFSLYETATYFYIIGADLLDRKYRILKIDRTAEPGDLAIVEDDIIYTKKEMNQILNAVDEGNKNSGGLKLRCSTWGLLGFIRFTGPYYMLFITKRSQVAMIGGHYVYQIDGTELVQLTSTRTKSDKNPEEARFVGILNNLDLNRSFYFSYSYDITQTMQHNIMRERSAMEEGLKFPLQHELNEMFVWNHYLLAPAREAIRNVYDWCLPIIHGYVDQASLSIYWGRVVYITIIARRSRFFAGARFLKRGANDLGYVANDVETEQIVAEMSTTSFHAPGPRLYANPNYTSYVQHRGSIPLYWTQDASGVTPKPDIELNLVDPFYSAAALHFDNLFERYGAPIYVLNLVKSRERTPRESKLLKEFTTAVSYLNQFLPVDKKILYKAWDMSRASKSRDQDVIGTLESIGEEVIPITGFFRNGADAESGLQLQNGIARTNCIDCLDRTNAAQFVIGKRALGHQLHALGIIDDVSAVAYDSDTVDIFTTLWHDHGDTIAVQYGGSHLVNTMATYRKINQWTSHSRDMVESFKRYYNNSFMDAQRQEAYNLFLGNYVFAQGQPMLWELSTDYYLHHTDPRAWLEKERPAYINWFTPENLRRIEPPSTTTSLVPEEKSLAFFDDYWLEYYRPLAVSSFQKMFSFKMHSNLRYIPFKNAAEGKYDLSPFKPRAVHDRHQPEAESNEKPKTNRPKGVKILEPSENETLSEGGTTPQTPIDNPAHPLKLKPSSLGPWVQAKTHSPHMGITGIMKDPSFRLGSSLPLTQVMTSENPTSLPSKDQQSLEAFTRLVQKSLHPTVDDEIDEYERYVSHPLTLPLVVRTDEETNTLAENGFSYNNRQGASADVLDFIEYVNKASSTVSSSQYPDHNNTTFRSDGGPGPAVPNTAASSAFSGPLDSTAMTTTGIRSPQNSFLTIEEVADQSLDEYRDFLFVGDEGLSVRDEDTDKKRYKRYRQWLRGKSLFKQRD